MFASAYTFRFAEQSDAASLRFLNLSFNAVEIQVSTIEERIKANTELVVVAEFGKEIVGFGCAHLFTSFCYTYPIIEVTELYVQDRYRRNGVATGILKRLEMVGLERKVTDSRLETGSGNTGSQHFYESIGYERQNELVYRKKL